MKSQTARIHFECGPFFCVESTICDGLPRPAVGNVDGRMMSWQRWHSATIHRARFNRSRLDVIPARWNVYGDG
ncbi:hypothetical protein RBSWK_01243 [Rhodopirellula baltica SWK14]|uniref:Uncharacterized protein n=1 Tax=Rhodopirellula baltica SWK14 TaxID=993516 RepID=L7CNU1_RHOBT|nr:hypothetical protein RBSWK_01243 [Rhodopirellula baltica SWK14]